MKDLCRALRFALITLILFGITADSTGSIYVVGYFSGNYLVVGADTLLGSNKEMYLIKYDSSGSVLWAITNNNGLNMLESANRVEVDKFGGVYVIGEYKGSYTTFGSDTLINMGDSDVFIAKYDYDGNYIWATSLGGSWDDYGLDITVDSEANIYVAGKFLSDSLAFSSDTLIKSGGWNSYLAKFDSSGNFVWAKNPICTWVSVTGSSDPYSYQWSDPATQTTDTATGLSMGFYAVTVSDAFGCIDSSTVTVDNGVALSEGSGSSIEVLIHPNPNSGEFMVQLRIERPTNIQIVIFDNLGKELLRTVSIKITSQFEIPLDLREYSTGVYRVQLITEQGIVNKQLVIE